MMKKKEETDFFKKSKRSIKSRIKTSQRNRKQYRIFESKQFLGIILIAISVYLFVVSIVEVTGFSTINSYTFGMLFGYYSYFFYVGFIIFGLCYLFQINIRLDKFVAVKFSKKIYFSWTSYILFAIGVALVVESSIRWFKDGSPFPNSEAFRSFLGDWWNGFTNLGDGSRAALPNIKNSGVIISLFMSLIVSWSGCIVSIIVGLLLVSYFFYFMFLGSIIKKIRYKLFGDPSKKDMIKKSEFEEYKTKIMDLSFEDKAGMIEKPKLNIASNVEAKTTTISINNPSSIFPVDDPFNDSLNEKKHDFLEEETMQINLEKNITKEFKLDTTENKIKPAPDIETFDFELDIFKTKSMNVMDFDINNISIDTKDVNLSNNNSEIKIDEK